MFRVIYWIIWVLIDFRCQIRVGKSWVSSKLTLNVKLGMTYIAGVYYLYRLSCATFGLNSCHKLITMVEIKLINKFDINN